MNQKRLNQQVTDLIEKSAHPLHKEIDALRKIILAADDRLSETIKWNGPNYSINGEDRITIRMNPPKQVQVIFHRGAKVQKQPPAKMIDDNSGLLTWRENDRAIASFKTMEEVKASEEALNKIVKDWLMVTVGR